MQGRNFRSLIILALTLLFSASASAEQRFVAALNSIQQVPPTNSTGRGTCEIRLDDNAQPPTLHLACSYSGLSSGVVSAHLHGNAPAGQNADIVMNLNYAPNTTSGAFLFAEPVAITASDAANIRAKRWYIDLHTANFPNGEIRGQLKIVTIDSDVDGDGRTDIIVHRPNTGAAYALLSTNNSFRSLSDGFAGDNPFFTDFDGDGISDFSSLRLSPANGSTTTVYTILSRGAFRAVNWGNLSLGDIYSYGDYDGDGTIDIAVYRKSNGVWYILQSFNNQPRYESWGQPDTDSPCPGDYDKDGKTDLCVIRNENGRLAWYIRRSSDNQSRRIDWGLAGDTTIFNHPADVDGDGATDVMVSRTDANGRRFFYALRSSDNSVFALQWGLTEDRIKLGDFDGDGKTDFAALRAVNNQLFWFIRQSSDNQMRIVHWGLPGDV